MVRMEALTPQARWDRYKAVAAAEKSFADDKTPESALALCKAAVDDKSVDPDMLCEALLTVEKGYRAMAKDDGGALSRQTLASLNGACVTDRTSLIGD